MGGFEIVVSKPMFIRIILLAIFVPVVIFSLRLLIPRLSPSARKLALAFLFLQLLVIFISQEVSGGAWLWNLTKEGNIPATLASTQLAMVATVSLLNAWLAKTRRTRLRLYLAGIGLVFLYTASDEFYKLHEFAPYWAAIYAALGLSIVLITVALARRSTREARVWHFCFLAGLGASAFGALFLDIYSYERVVCSILGVIKTHNCLKPGLFEESLEFVGVWLVLVAVLGHFSTVAPMPSMRVRLALYLSPLIWIILLVLSILIPRSEYWLYATPASVHFESEFSLDGYRIDHDKDAVHVQLFVTANPRIFPLFGFSLHLVDQETGTSIASQNDYGDWIPDHLLANPGYQTVSRQWIGVDIPPGTPPNRALWIVLSLWEDLWETPEDDYKIHRIVDSDLSLLSDKQVILGEFAPRAEADHALSQYAAVFDNGFKLGPVRLPAQVTAGESLALSFLWQSSEDTREDYTQFLHFVHKSSGAQWGFDQSPLGSRLPTRFWYSGLADSEIWEIPIPEDLEPGRYDVFTGLYRNIDQQRVRATDATGKFAQDARVLLGGLTVQGAN